MKKLLFAISSGSDDPENCAQQFSLGKPVSDFTVQDTRGRLLHFRAMKGNVTVVMFFSTRCPISNALISDETLFTETSKSA